MRQVWNGQVEFCRAEDSVEWSSTLERDVAPDPIRILPEEKSWRARPVRYFAGSWDQIRMLLPSFELREFTAFEGAPANPYYRTVLRHPLLATETPIPVGIVSNSYNLLQHTVLGDLCVAALAEQGFPTEQLRCEAGISELGEWVNLRFELPEGLRFTPPDRHPLALRLEVFNSVDGSARLSALMSWFRLVCSNGLVVRKTMTEISDRHDSNLDVGLISDVLTRGLKHAQADREALVKWARSKVAPADLERWVNGSLTKAWGVKAAARVYHICASGRDASLAPPFEKCRTTDKPVIHGELVPGAYPPAKTIYDVSQALSWVATHRRNADDRIAWLEDIPHMLRYFEQKQAKARKRS